MKKLAAHVTFFYIESRLHWLEEVVNGLKSIGKDDVDVFVHTNKSFSISNAEVIVHNLDGIHLHLLTWLSRPMMEQQLGQYQHYMYIEDDVLKMLVVDEPGCYVQHLPNNYADTSSPFGKIKLDNFVHIQHAR